MAEQARLAFPREEYEQRLRAVRQKMRERGVDVLLVDTIEHLLYLAGSHAAGSIYQVYIVPLDGDPIMVVRTLDEAPFLERAWTRDRVTFADWEDPVLVLARTLGEKGWGDKRLGVELDSHFLPVRRYEAIRAALPTATFVDFSGVVWDLRYRKSPREIARLRQAATVVDAAMVQAVGAVAEGRSVREVAAAGAHAFIMLGADGGWTGPIIAGGRARDIHGELGDHRLERGDVVHIELVPSVNGYSARLMRPVVVGPPSPEQRDVAQALIAIQDEQLAAMKPGVIAREVDAICRERVLKAGLRDTYTNITGYTVGAYGTRMPPRSTDFSRSFMPTADWALEAGMVFHMYTSARTIAFSETVLVTESGHERLTQTERRIFVR